MRRDRWWENALLRTSSRKELLERNPCWSCNSQLSASPPLDLRLHSLLSIGTSPTFEQFEESLVLESSLPGTVRSMWRAAVGGLLALLGKQLWRQQHQQHWQQHLLGAPILVTALTQCFSYSFTASPPFWFSLSISFTRWQLCGSSAAYHQASSYLPYLGLPCLPFLILYWICYFSLTLATLYFQILHNSYFSHNSWFTFTLTIAT